MEGPFVIVLCIVCFLVGFLSVALYVSWQQATHLRRRLTSQSPQWPHIGCEKVMKLMKTHPPRAVEYKKTLTGVELIDVELQKVINFGVRDYFERWYHPQISPDPICVQAAVDIINHVVTEVSDRSKEVDYLCFFVETIMDDIMEHLRQYKRAGQVCEDECEDGSWADLTPMAKARKIEKAFFDKEPANNPWKAICCSQPARLAYLHRLTELLLCVLLPESDFSNAPLQVLLTGIIVHQVWLPLLRTLTQPDNINSFIISLSKEGALTPETFMASVGDVLSDLELRVLQIKIQEHIRNLQRTGVTDEDQQKLSGLESLMETTKQLLEGGGSRRMSSQNSTMMSFNVSIPHFTIVPESGSKHCLFKLCVECRHSQAAVVERWETHRRYRDFYDLHLTLRSELGNFPANLTIPSLPSFNKLDQKRLEVRRQSLNSYLQTVTSNKFLRTHPKALGHLILFLTAGHYTRTKTELTRMVDSLLFQPLRRTASMTIEAMKSTATITSSQPAVANGSPKASPQLRKQTFDVKPPPEEDEESLPVDMMLELLDELFDISDGGQWIRRQLPMLLKQLAGGKISRKIVETSDWLTSAEQVAGYIRDLRNTMWPGGFPAVPRQDPPPDVRALRTLVARAQIVGSIPDDLKRFIGSDTTVRGMIRFFSMFQSESLNYRLALVLIEGFLDTLLPDRNLKNTFRKLRIELKKRTT